MPWSASPKALFFYWLTANSQSGSALLYFRANNFNTVDRSHTFKKRIGVSGIVLLKSLAGLHGESCTDRPNPKQTHRLLDSLELTCSANHMHVGINTKGVYGLRVRVIPCRR